MQSIGRGNELDIFERSKNVSGIMTKDTFMGEYYEYKIDCGSAWEIIFNLILSRNEFELSDHELRTLAMNSESYEFWRDPKEDIYSLEDGEPT